MDRVLLVVILIVVVIIAALLGWFAWEFLSGIGDESSAISLGA